MASLANLPNLMSTSREKPFAARYLTLANWHAMLRATDAQSDCATTC